MADFSTIIFEADSRGIATVTVNRPDKLNALNNQVLNELADAFEEIQTDDQIKAVIISGSGGEAFVAGADIKELQQLDKSSGQKASQKGQQVFQLIEDTRKPVIAAVNGYALGGGAELALACHLRIAGSNTVFGLPETGLGLIPGYGGTQRLPKLIGRARALEIILTGKQLNADEALHMGLVNEVAEDSVAAAIEMIKKILSKAPLSIQKALKALYQSGRENGFETETHLFGELCETEDAREGTSAFLEKRKPDFKGN